ncbi:MAG: hypothetical protein MZV63_58570 [Marinilabiliales bacterium]|nr:hypothetical protein [Marinilabiliales bacterium]
MNTPRALLKAKSKNRKNLRVGAGAGRFRLGDGRSPGRPLPRPAPRRACASRRRSGRPAVPVVGDREIAEVRGPRPAGPSCR